MTLKSPFCYPGGKSRIAPMAWQRLDGDNAIAHYIEPFLGSAAMLLARPWKFGDERVWETANDLDGLLTNTFRGIREHPAEVAEIATACSQSELDLHARHDWLIANRERITAGLRADPQWCDVKAAGWWLWGMASWIGHGFGWSPSSQLPALSPTSKGILRDPKPVKAVGALGLHKAPPIAQWMDMLAQRLLRVRLACGDWSRVVSSAILLSCNPDFPPTAVFLDPPYERGTGYGAESAGVSADVSEWCRENGDNPRLRIALCGHVGDHDLPGWDTVVWKRRPGGRNAKSTSSNPECVWFSPHCVGARQGSLFE